MPRGSALRVDGRAAGPTCKHAVPSPGSRRISMTFRRLSEESKQRGMEQRMNAEATAKAKIERKRAKKRQARGNATPSIGTQQAAVRTARCHGATRASERRVGRFGVERSPKRSSAQVRSQERAGAQSRSAGPTSFAVQWSSHETEPTSRENSPPVLSVCGWPVPPTAVTRGLAPVARPYNGFDDVRLAGA